MVYYTVSRYNEDMFLGGILSWWYTKGWRQRVVLMNDRLARTSDFFSIGLLASTLFSPFRQISAGRVSGPIAVQLRAFVDQLISRLIGSFVRGFMIIFGLVTLTLQVILGGALLVFWALVPTLPVVGLLLMVIGWVPTWK